MGQDNHSGAIPPERDEPSGPDPEQADGGANGGVPPAPQHNLWGPPVPQQNPWDQQSQRWAGPGGTQAGPQQPWGVPVYPQQGGWTPPPKPGVIPLRPLGLGELLDGAFQACRKNAAATFGTALLIQAVIALLTFLFARGVFSLDVFSTDFDTTEFEIADGALGWSLTAAALLGVASVVGVLLLQGMLVVPVARSILNLKTGFGQVWRLCRPRLPALAGMGLLLIVMISVGALVFGFLLILIVEFLGPAGIPVLILGILALVAGFIWLGVKLALAPAALVLEPAGIFESLRRSWQLTRRNFWRSFGILALTSILVSIVSSVISTPVLLLVNFAAAFGSSAEPDTGTALALLAINAAISTFFGAIGYAFQAAVTSLLYVDLRIRREGLDLTLMKEQELAGTDPDLLPGRRNGKYSGPGGGAASSGWGQPPYDSPTGHGPAE